MRNDWKEIIKESIKVNTKRFLKNETCNSCIYGINTGWVFYSCGVKIGLVVGCIKWRAKI